ncbi:MAG: prenyltransferase/squalene oxidase repeat-containing protein [Solirubrobacteraceae bacterium]
MTWQLGAFGILGLALAGGFAWYERTRPDARIVALVGTLAAFAALGRIAFAALPNVKPTTDIVLVSGYALGSGPGFAVGALAGLASNFFFGQGPWTPWQMAGWGATGVIGAGLARVTGRRIGRWTLALVCTVVGFGFTALQDFGDWVTYSNHSLGELGIYVGKGIGFDCIHAGGCLVFALALGPALIRSLSRFAMRLHVTWRPVESAPRVGAAISRAGLLFALLLGGWLAGQPGGVGRAVAASRPVARATAAGTPAGYLLAAQNPDGGFGPAPGQSSLQLYAGWVALGLAAAGENPQDIQRDGHSVIDYIESGLAANTDPGSVERTILVVRAAGLSAESFGGRNLVSALERDIGRNGAVSDQTNWTAFAILALRAADVAPAPATVSWMVRQEDSDGGFNYGTRGGSSDVDDTGSVLEALAGVGGSAASHARTRAVRYIRSQQDADGGFPSQPGSGSNAQSTAFAIQGLIAAGVDPGSLHRRGAPSPLQYLDSLIAGDGRVDYSRGVAETATWVTGETLMALEGKPLPLAPVALPKRASPAPAHHATPGANGSRRTKNRPTVTHHTRRPPRVATPVATRASADAPVVDRLVMYAGILTALTLAPLGQG